MSEEALLVLKMVQEGKITPEQGIAFLEALKKSDAATSSQTSGASFSEPPGGAGAQWSAASHAQQVLAQLQQQLAEMQAKIGAAQASSTADPSQPSRVKLPFGFGELNITRIIDDAMRGVSALRSEAVISAKKAARQAQKEARRFRAEAERVGKNIHVEVRVRADDRPSNISGFPEASARDEVAIELPEDGLISIRNPFGDVKIVGTSPDDKVHATADKTVWASSASEREEGLKNVRIEEVLRPDGIGRELIVTSSNDISVDHVAVNLSIQVPARATVEAFTTYGEVHCESIEGGVTKVETSTGNVRLLHVHDARSEETGAERRVQTRSGSISVNQWRGGALTVESANGEIRLDTIEAPRLEVRAVSSDAHIRGVKLSGAMRCEALSGDVEIEDAVLGGKLFAKTQSGDLSLKQVEAESLTLEGVSGDVIALGATATADGIGINAISGDIQATGLMGRELSMNTTSGDVTVAMAEKFDGTVACATVSGDVSIGLPASYRARLTMTTHSGDLKCAFPLGSREGDGEHYLNGVIGEAGDALASATLQSVSGDLAVRQAG